jgi:hypothetical protein
MISRLSEAGLKELYCIFFSSKQENTLPQWGFKLNSAPATGEPGI